ncbi:hypothetical protein ONZ45_g2527 [Pleurotus djamor]|nr:hypothetical protein ONZ45_g2527 [Pleurotus djamor]
MQTDVAWKICRMLIEHKFIMRSSFLVLVFAAVFVLARPIEDTVDEQDVFDLAKKPAKAPAKKPAPKKPATKPTSKGSSIGSKIGSGLVDIAGQAASGVTSTLTQAGIDALTGSGEAPVAEEPAPDA